MAIYFGGAWGLVLDYHLRKGGSRDWDSWFNHNIFLLRQSAERKQES